MANNRQTRVYSLVAFESLVLIRATSNTTLPYTSATVANSTGINDLSRRHWTQRQVSPQEDGIPLRLHSLDTADTFVKELVWAARLSSHGSTRTSNHCSLRRLFLALRKVHTHYPVTPHHNQHTRPQEQDSIHHRLESRIMDEGLATMDTAKHPRTDRSLIESHQDMPITQDVIPRGRTRLAGAHTADRG